MNKIVFMILLGIYELGLVIENRHLLKIEEEIKFGMFKDLRMVINLLIGIIPIAECIIGALG